MLTDLYGIANQRTFSRLIVLVEDDKARDGLRTSWQHLIEQQFGQNNDERILIFLSHQLRKELPPLEILSALKDEQHWEQSEEIFRAISEKMQELIVPGIFLPDYWLENGFWMSFFRNISVLKEFSDWLFITETENSELFGFTWAQAHTGKLFVRQALKNVTVAKIDIEAAVSAEMILEQKREDKRKESK